MEWMMDIWDEATAERSLRYLSETDEEFAVAKARVFGLDKTEKVILAEEFLNGTGTVDQRKSMALTSDKYADWQKSHEDAVLDFNILYAKRTTKAAYLECWRSVFSARRRGNV